MQRTNALLPGLAPPACSTCQCLNRCLCSNRFAQTHWDMLLACRCMPSTERALERALFSTGSAQPESNVKPQGHPLYAQAESQLHFSSRNNCNPSHSLWHFTHHLVRSSLENATGDMLSSEHQHIPLWQFHIKDLPPCGLAT